MGQAFAPLRDNPEFIESISYFTGDFFGSYFASILMGCLLTMIVQSSAAMLGITMALATSGVIPYHTAIALLLGENIGSTISAMLASIGTNVNAKRAARVHAIFNILSVIAVSFILLIFSRQWTPLFRLIPHSEMWMVLIQMCLITLQWRIPFSTWGRL